MTVPTSATASEMTLGAQLREPFEALIEHNYALLSATGFDDLRLAHGAVFRHIARDGSRVADLARRAWMTKQSMSELVSQLHAAGYLDIKPDPDDGRAKRVFLSERGWQAWKAIASFSREFEQRIARGIGKDEWQQFRRLLGRIVEYLDRQRSQP